MKRSREKVKKEKMPFHELHIGYTHSVGGSLIILKCYDRQVTEVGITPDGLCLPPTTLTFKNYDRTFRYYEQRKRQLKDNDALEFAYEFHWI